MGSEKSNPGALAGATGANSKAGQLRQQNSPRQPGSAISKWISARHRSASRNLGYALTAGDFSAWERFSILLALRLTRQERGALAWAALRSLEPNIAADVADTVLSAGEEAA